MLSSRQGRLLIALPTVCLTISLIHARSAETTPLTIQSRVPLLDGRAIPALGLGVYSVTPGEPTYRSVMNALQAGVRHIDTAELYANEADVGRALVQSHIPRSHVWVTTKVLVGRFAQQQPDYNETLAAGRASVRERLGLDYADLLLLHSPYGANDRLSRWAALLELQREGVARSVGVSNYGVQHLREIERAGLPLPVINQIELSPWLRRRELEAYCRKRAIVLEQWGALAKGRRLHGVDQLDAIAEARGAQPVQVLMRWGLQMGNVVLFTTTNPAHLSVDIDLYGFGLSANQMGKMDLWEDGFRTGWDPANEAE